MLEIDLLFAIGARLSQWPAWLSAARSVAAWIRCGVLQQKSTGPYALTIHQADRVRAMIYNLRLATVSPSEFTKLMAVVREQDDTAQLSDYDC